MNGLILPGVTRRSIIELASQWEDIVVKEEAITMDRVIELNKQGRVSILLLNSTRIKRLRNKTRDFIR